MISQTAQDRKKRLIAELEKHGARVDPALGAMQDADLEELLRILKSKNAGTDISDSEGAYANYSYPSYAAMLADYIHKVTIASVLFFATYPWAALWWPPFYFYSHHKQRRRGK